MEAKKRAISEAYFDLIGPFGHTTPHPFPAADGYFNKSKTLVLDTCKKVIQQFVMKVKAGGPPAPP